MVDWRDPEIEWEKKEGNMDEDKENMASQDGLERVGMAARIIVYHIGVGRAALLLVLFPRNVMRIQQQESSEYVVNHIGVAFR